MADKFISMRNLRFLQIQGLSARLKESGDGLTVAMKPEWFE